MRQLDVAAFTQGRTAASARFRVRQFIDPLRSFNIAIREFPARYNSYAPRKRWLRVPWGLASLASRVPAVVGSHRYDLVLLQREFISTLPTLEFAVGRPRMLDVDDAIWLNGRLGSAARIARSVDLVVCGNTFLATYFGRHNPNVAVIPTAVDTSHFTPRTRPSRPDRIVLGWSGTSGGFGFVEDVLPAIARVMGAHREVHFHVVSDREPNFLKRLPPDRVAFIKWHPDSEGTSLHDFDIGLMPLRDDDWCRGKCSFKMLTYMASQLPVVVSPVGMNADVLAQGKVGLAATTEREWFEALSRLVQDAGLRSELGAHGLETVNRHYSIQVIAPRIAAALRDVSQGLYSANRIGVAPKRDTRARTGASADNEQSR